MAGKVVHAGIRSREYILVSRRLLAVMMTWLCRLAMQLKFYCNPPEKKQIQYHPIDFLSKNMAALPKPSRRVGTEVLISPPHASLDYILLCNYRIEASSAMTTSSSS